MNSDTLHLDNIIIDPEIEAENYIRTEAELQALQQQISKDGEIREPLTIWTSGKGLMLVDGFGRHKCGKALGFSNVPVVYKDFESIEQVKIWIRINQDSRRNLTDHQSGYYIGRLYNQLLSEPKLRKLYFVEKGITEEPADLAVYMGLVYRVNEKTVRRYSKIAKGIDRIGVVNLDLSKALLGGSSKIPAALLEFASEVDLDELEGVEGSVDLGHRLKEVLSRDKPVKKAKRSEIGIKKALQDFLSSPTKDSRQKLLDLVNNFNLQSELKKAG